ncbi:MAG: YggS family pyridoxal phosphate-dependent enzyme [Flavobacteriia bacterium]|nr:YggS family pyridoxal phosphate-dependent enzyme [Flavobacteriia bacterium]OJX36815.1 MAG: YggS family pyridoxal phosphate enzyme [Flavobacteriia bacterium 40-80]
MIAENLKEVLSGIPDHVKLVAVSKMNPVERVMEAYDAGQRIFGENKVQELLPKYEALPKDIEWHLIGHLQTNKVKFIAPFISMIHSVDSFRLLEEINKQAKKNNRVIDVLLQFHIADEETKYGFVMEEIREMVKEKSFYEMENVRISGVMGMASNTENSEQVRFEFIELANIFETLKSHFFKFNDDFKEISMGMSGDYQLAIEEGSTIVRVGSKIFK